MRHSKFTQKLAANLVTCWLLWFGCLVAFSVEENQKVVDPARLISEKRTELSISPNCSPDVKPAVWQQADLSQPRNSAVVHTSAFSFVSENLKNWNLISRIYMTELRSANLGPKLF